MTSYERRCRLLLKAFPADYRSERADEIVGVLLDTSRPGQRWPSLRTVADLVSAGIRVRGKLATQGRASVAVIEGMRMAALVGLCVQAAFSVAMVAHYARDGVLFYLVDSGWSTAAHGRLAALWVVAFVLVVAGRPRLAIIPSVMGSAGSLILFIGNFRGGNFGLAASPVILIAVQMTLLGLVPTLALMVACTRAPRTGNRRSLLWLAALPALTAMFSFLDTGASSRGLSFPPSGNLVSVLFWVWVAALVVTALASTFDPRLGVATIVVSLPVAVYELGMLVSFGPIPRWPAVLVIPALATTALVAVNSALSLRRLRTR